MAFSTNWREVSGHLTTLTGKLIKGLGLPIDSGDAVNKAYADESRGLFLSYGANKTLTAADFLGRDLSKARVSIKFTAAATVYLPNDASRVEGARITFTRAFNGNLVIDGNGASVQGRSHSYGGSNWFVWSSHGTITYEWTGSVWAYVGIPAGVDGQIQAQAVYDPNALAFVDNGVSRTGVLPVQRASGSIASGGAINCDHVLTDGKRSKVLFRFSVGTDFVLEYEAVAKRSGATVTLLTPLKTIFGASDYTSPPSVTPVLSSQTGGVLRVALTQSTGSTQACTASSIATEQ